MHRNKKLPLLLLLLVVYGSSCKERVIYTDEQYTIQLKNLVSYYQASPDLLVKTDSGTAKINLNPFGKILIPQEKITSVNITKNNADSITIFFAAADTYQRFRNEVIGVNVKYALDSIFRKKKAP